MTRTLFAVALLLALPAAVHAQYSPFRPAFAPNAAPNGQAHVGVSGLVEPPIGSYPNFGTQNIVGGLTPSNLYGPGFPFSGVFSGGYGYGGWYNSTFPFPGYVAPPPVIVIEPVQVVVVPAAVATRKPLSTEAFVTPANEYPATLVLEFPTAAEVWLNGKKIDGDSKAEWTLTSPSLQPGGEYTFDVKARWKSGGKTYEYSRTATVASGQRSKAVVVNGTEVK